MCNNNYIYIFNQVLKKLIHRYTFVIKTIYIALSTYIDNISYSCCDNINTNNSEFLL